MIFKLSDVAHVTMGQSPKSEFFNDTGTGEPFLQGVRTFGRLYPTIDTYTTEYNRLATQGSILFSVRAPVGQLNWANQDIAIGRGLAAIEPVSEFVNPDYLYYLLKSMGAVIDSQSNGTVFTSINKTELNNLAVDLPDLAQQEKIGTTLRLLDDKIESLSEINDNLLELALAEYRRKIETTATTQMKLGDIAKISAGGDKPKVVRDLASDEVRVPIYSNGITNEGLYGFTDNPKIFEKSVTVSARGTIGYLAIREEPYYPIVRLISVIPALEKFTNHQLYLALTDANIQGSGTTQQQLTVPVFKSTMLSILPEETRTEIEELISPLFDMITHNKHEIVTLSETRDSLLKKSI